MLLEFTSCWFGCSGGTVGVVINGPTLTPTPTPTPSPSPTPLTEAVRRYLLGIDSDPAGLDLNSDGAIDIGDAIHSLPPPAPPPAASPPRGDLDPLPNERWGEWLNEIDAPERRPPLWATPIPAPPR